MFEFQRRAHVAALRSKFGANAVNAVASEQGIAESDVQPEQVRDYLNRSKSVEEVAMTSIEQQNAKLLSEIESKFASVLSKP